MNIKELQPGQGSVNIELTVKSLDEIKIINKYGRELRLRNAIATDGEDEIKLTLWNQDVDRVQVGSVIKITNGYVNEFQGEKQLTTGKFGKLEVEGEASQEQPAEQPEQTEQPEQAPAEPEQPVEEQPAEQVQEAPSGDEDEEVMDY